MKLSMMTYTMARQQKLYGFDIDRMLELTSELGLGIDWIGTYGEDPLLLKKKCDDKGIEIAAYTFPGSGFINADPSVRKETLDKCRRELETAVKLTAPVVMVITPGGNMDRDTCRDLYIQGLAQLMPYAQDAGIEMTVENFPGANSPFVTAGDFFKAKTLIPELKLTFDNGNAAGGEDPVESFKKCAADVVHVHFKDWYISDTPREGYRQMLNGKYFKPALISEGDIDTAGCCKAMCEYGYDGYINIEYEGNDIKASDGIRKAVEYLREKTHTKCEKLIDNGTP